MVRSGRAVRSGRPQRGIASRRVVIGVVMAARVVRIVLLRHITLPVVVVSSVIIPVFCLVVRFRPLMVIVIVILILLISEKYTVYWCLALC